MFKVFDPFSTIESLPDILDIDLCFGLFITQSEFWLEEFDQFTIELLSERSAKYILTTFAMKLVGCS